MNKTCPLIKDSCMEHKCTFYTHILGVDPQTNKPVDHWDCAVAWIPILLVENSQEQRKTGASVQSFRNEMVKQNRHLIYLAGGEANLLEDRNGDAS